MLEAFTNSSPAAVGFCRSTLVQTVRRKSRRRISQPPPFHQFVDMRGLIGFQHTQNSLFSCGGSPSSGIEMRKTPRRIQASLRESMPAEPPWEDLPPIFPGCDPLRALLNQAVWPPEIFVRSISRHGETSRFCSSALRSVMRVPEYSAASTTSTPADIRLRIRLRIGKFCGAANLPSETPKSGPRSRQESARPDANFHWDKSRQRRCQIPRCFHFGRDRAAMAGGVDSPRHAADNHPSLRCQAAAALRDCPEPITPSAGRKFLLAVVDNENPRQ
jgi:hypothetical protein